MNIQINIGSKAVITFAVIVAFFFGTQAAEAASTSTPKVLCVQKSGALVARATCKSGESKFSVMPGTVTKKLKSAKRLSAPLRTQNALTNSAPLSVSATSLSLLSNSTRTFTTLVEIPPGTRGLQKLQPPYAPSCPADAPLGVTAGAYPVADGQQYSISVGTLGEYVVQGSADYLWKLQIPVVVEADGTFGFYIDFRENEGDGFTGPTSLPWAVKSYLVLTCAPIVDLVAAP